MSQIWKVFRGMTFLTIAEVFSRGVGALATFYLARVLEPEWFGKLNFAWAFYSYFLFLSIFGLDMAGIRAIARAKEKAANIVGNMVPLFVLMSTLSSVIMLIVSFVIAGETVDRCLIQLFVLSILVNVLTIEWLFQGFENQERVALSRIIQRGVYCAGVLLISTQEDVYIIPIIMAVSVVFSQLYLWAIFLYRNRVRLCLSKEFALDTIKFALPIGLAGFTSAAYHNTDSIMLGFMRTSSEVGYYNAAAKITLFIALIRHLAMQSAFPRLSDLFANHPEKFRVVSLHLQVVMSSVAVPIMFAIGSFSKEIIIFLYGNNYLSAANVMPYLLAGVVLLYSSFIFLDLLNVIGRSWDYLKVTLSAAVVNVFFNYIWIPKRGIVGAAMGTIMAEATILLVSFYLTRKVTKFRFVHLFGPIIVGTIAMMGTSNLVENNFLRVVLGLAGYCFFWVVTYNLAKKSIIRTER